MPRSILAALLVLSLALSACGAWGVGCPLILYPSVHVEVRDAQGEPTANGATVTIRDAEGYKASTMGVGERPGISVGEDGRSGPFTVEVTKPYHTSVVVENVRAPTGYCGLTGPAEVAVTLHLEPGAPLVRQVVVHPGPYGYSGGFEDRVTAYVEAAPGVSREVVWSSSDTSVMTVTPDGRTRAACRETPGRATLTATSVVDPTRQGSLEVTVGGVSDATCVPLEG